MIYLNPKKNPTNPEQGSLPYSCRWVAVVFCCQVKTKITKWDYCVPTKHCISIHTYVHNLTSIYFRYRYKKWTLLLITKQTEPVHNICGLQHLCDFFYSWVDLETDNYTPAVNSQYRDELQGSTCIGRLPFVLRRQMMTMSTMMRLSRMTAQMTPMMITSVSVRSVFWDCPTKHNKAQTWITMFNK